MSGTPKTTHEQREALRTEWETDPAATFSALGARIGLRASSLSSHAKLYGWARTTEVILQARFISAARNAQNIRGAVERGYVPSTEAATAARLGRELPVKYKKDRRYPCWDTRQKERTYTPPPLRFSSIWDYASRYPRIEVSA